MNCLRLLLDLRPCGKRGYFTGEKENADENMQMWTKIKTRRKMRM